MKAAALTLATAACLAGCHANPTRQASTGVPAASSSTAASKPDKSLEKSRNSLLDKTMNVQGQHWATDPAPASTATTTPSPATASSAASPAASSSAAKAGAH